MGPLLYHIKKVMFYTAGTESRIFWCELRKLFLHILLRYLAPTDEGAAHGLAN